jgi:hypothetical protein
MWPVVLSATASPARKAPHRRSPLRDQGQEDIGARYRGPAGTTSVLRTITAAVPLDKIFRLHTPTWQTTPPTCFSCGAPIRRLDDWLNSECPVDEENRAR